MLTIAFAVLIFVFSIAKSKAAPLIDEDKFRPSAAEPFPPRARNDDAQTPAETALFEVRYSPPAFLQGSPKQFRREFRRLWEHGVRTLNRDQLEHAVVEWVQLKHDARLTNAFAVYDAAVKAGMRTIARAAKETLSPHARAIWLEYFDHLNGGAPSTLSLAKSLERAGSVFRALPEHIRAEIADVLDTPNRIDEE